MILGITRGIERTVLFKAHKGSNHNILFPFHFVTVIHIFSHSIVPLKLTPRGFSDQEIDRKIQIE